MRQKTQKQRKQRLSKASASGSERFEAIAYCTADEYTSVNLTQRYAKYQVCPIDPEIGDEAVLIRVFEDADSSDHNKQVKGDKGGHSGGNGHSYGHGTDGTRRREGQVFLFRDLGSVVFWNVSKIEINKLLSNLTHVQHNPVPPTIVHKEAESMDYVLEYQDGDNVHSGLTKGTIHLKMDTGPNPTPNILDQYSFSNAIALSVKLASYEANLDQFSEGIQVLAEKMRDGDQISLNEKGAFQKSGELFTLRHEINLNHSDFLDPPDFYWDRPDIENLFAKTCAVLNIPKRTKLMNDKLSYCYELLQLLHTHLSDKHSSKLEWYIIALISVEIVFSVPHLLIALGFIE